jgi:hypothetical protein
MQTKNSIPRKPGFADLSVLSIAGDIRHISSLHLTPYVTAPVRIGNFVAAGNVHADCEFLPHRLFFTGEKTCEH